MADAGAAPRGRRIGDRTAATGSRRRARGDRGHQRGAHRDGPVGVRPRSRPRHDRRQRPPAVPCRRRATPPPRRTGLPSRPIVGSVRRLRRAPDGTPHLPRPRLPRRSRRPRPAHHPDPGRAGRPGLRAPGRPSGSPATARSWALRCCSTTTSSGVLTVWRTRGRPVRRSRHQAPHRVRRCGGDRRPQHGPRARPRSPQRRARPQGRPARGAGPGRGGGELQPRPRHGALDDRHARRAAVRHRRRLVDGVRSEASSASSCARPTGPATRCSNSCATPGSRCTTRSSAAPRWRRDRCRSRTCTGMTLDVHQQLLHDAGWRSMVAVPMLRDGSIVGVLVMRRLRAGDFPEETLRTAADLRQPVGAGDPQRAAVPRARTQVRRVGGGQPPQVRVPRQHVARTAHPAQRRDRLLGGVARPHVRRDQRSPGGVPRRHPGARASTSCSSSATSWTCPRSRPAGWSWPAPRSRCARRSSTGSRWCASAPRATTLGLILDVDPAVGSVESDELRFKQVVLNLLSNAVKFTPDGGEIVVAATDRGRRRGDHRHRQRHRRRAGGPRAHLRVVPAGAAGIAARRRARAWV